MNSMQAFFLSSKPVRSSLTALMLSSTLAIAQTGESGQSKDASADSSKSSNQVKPQAIADAVENELRSHPAVAANAVKIRASDGGQISLSGTVDNLRAKSYAEKLAGTVRGVQSIDNQIRVEPTKQRMDWEVRRAIERALRRNVATDSWELDVEVESGEVVLEGTVDSWAEKNLARVVASGVGGVKSVENRVAVDYDTDRPDAELQNEIDERLRWNALIDDGLISVAVKDGRVTLTGTVGSYTEKNRAYYDAWVNGVDGVDTSGLRVSHATRSDEMRSDGSDTDDAKSLARAVERSLRYDAQVPANDIVVEAHDGTITLRGSVSSLSTKYAAATAARNTLGVSEIDNRIRVRNERADPEQLESAIREAIADDPYLQRYEVKPTVVGATAYLSGTVDTTFESSQAELVASGVAGITDVKNWLTVDDNSMLTYDPYLHDPYGWNPYVHDHFGFDPTPGVTFATDTEIRDDIRDELWWSPFVDSDQVRVGVEDGVATLEGSVSSWSESSSAVENAFEGGAIRVRNRLEIAQADSL